MSDDIMRKNFPIGNRPSDLLLHRVQPIGQVLILNT